MAGTRLKNNAEGVSQVLGRESAWKLHPNRLKRDYRDWKAL